MIELETYESLPASSNFLNPEKEIMVANNSDFACDETLSKVSLASISCILWNGNENYVFKKRTISRKKQTHEPLRNYIPSHLNKADKIQAPLKGEGKLALPLATMIEKLQHKTKKLQRFTFNK